MIKPVRDFFVENLLRRRLHCGNPPFPASGCGSDVTLCSATRGWAHLRVAA
jgi:hypothetical protein